MAHGKDPEKVKVREVMIKKTKTVSPSLDIYEAIIRMKRDKIKKLPVIYNNKVQGILTLNDILRIEPQLFDYVADIVYIREQAAKLKYRRTKSITETGVEGPCEKCGNYDSLAENDGRLICSECVDVLKR